MLIVLKHIVNAILCNAPSPRKKPQPKKMPYHYYKPRGTDECVTYLQNERGRKGPHHRFITEKQVFARWAKQYNITFTHPTWWDDWFLQQS